MTRVNRTRVVTGDRGWTEQQRATAARLLQRGVRVAQLRQACPRCPEWIRPGDLIGLDVAGWAHVACLPAELTQASGKGRRAARRALARREAAT